MGKCWGSEVTLDYGTKDVRRVDFMEFIPQNQIGVSGIEKGIFICYEVKSCKEDYFSGHGRNFVSEKNYFVMPMQTYREVLEDVSKDFNVGVIVPIPVNRDVYEEFEHPTPLDADMQWGLHIIKNSHVKDRKKSIIELLYCIARAGC